MAERLAQVPQQEIKKVESLRDKNGNLPNEDRTVLEQGLRGGGWWNGFTKKVQFGGAAVLAIPAPMIAAGLLAGGFYDHATQDYTDQWADKKEEDRQKYIQEKYGPNKTVVKGKVVDKYAYQAAKQATPKENGAKVFDLDAIRNKKKQETAPQSENLQQSGVVYEMNEHRSRRRSLFGLGRGKVA